MAGFCKGVLIGHLGRDPETRYTPTGKSVTSFSLACDSGKDASGEKLTEWFRVSAWGKLGEICAQYLHKGSLCYCEGRLRTRTWEGQDGQKRLEVEIVASDVQILDSRREGQGEGGEYGVVDEDAIPF